MTRAKDISKILTAPVLSGLTYPTTDGSSNQFMKTDGSGTLSFATVTGTTINNNADNRIITGSGTANTLEGEANLTFDGTNLDLSDSKYIRLGTGNDLQIYHNGSDSYIVDAGTGGLNIQADSFNLRNAAGNETGFQFIQNGAVSLYHDNSVKLATTSTGVTVTGTVTATSFSGDGSNLSGISSVGGSTGVDFNDNVQVRFGASQDMQIFHDGSNSKIVESGTGNLILQSSGTEIQIMNGSEFMGRFQNNDAVKLFFDNSKKFETTSGGVTVSGTLNATTGTFTNGDVNVTGTGNRSISVLSTNGLGTIEVGGASGGFIDIKQPQSDDFDMRLGSSGSGGYVYLSGGAFTVQNGFVNSVSGYQTNGTVLPFQSTPTEASTASSIGIGTGYTTVISQAIQHDANDMVILMAQIHVDTQSSGTAGQGDIRILASNTSQSAEIISQALLCDGARLRWNYTFTLRDQRGVSAVTTYTIQARKTHGSLTFNGGGASSKIVLIKQTV